MLMVQSCNQATKPKNNKVIIAVPGDANALNPLKARGETSNYLCLQLFQTLTGFDYNSEKLVGIVAQSAPKKELLDSNQIAFHYQLRKEASFDNGQPIDARAIYFSFLLANCPKVSYPGAADFYSFIDTVIWSEEKPHEISFICQNNYFLNVYATGDFFILPPQNYDPEGILMNYSLSQIRSFEDGNIPEKLEAFIENFNSQKFEKDPAYIKGSGAYEVSEWISNQRIILKKKNNWWAEKFQNQHGFFEAYPDQIQYEIITDQTASIAALKTGAIDLIKGVQPKDFIELKENSTINTSSHSKMGYSYLGFNMAQNPTDQLKLRKGIAFLIDKETILKQVLYQVGKTINSPILPTDTSRYLKDLKPYHFNLDSASFYLDDFKSKEISLRYLYNVDNEQRKLFGLILQDQLKNFQIDLEIVPAEWSVYLEKIKSGDFDLFYGSINSSPLPPDFFTSFHSESADGGRNYVNYKSNLADSLIQGIRKSKTEMERNNYYKAFQRQLSADLPMVILFSAEETFLYSDRIKQLKTSAVRPNYWAPSIKISAE